MIERLIIETEEGWSSTPYRDHLGYPTIGWGRLLIKDAKAPLPSETTNKPSEGIWLDRKIGLIVQQLTTRFPMAWSKCNDVQKAVLVSACYQLGLGGLGAFKKMWAALEDGDFKEASLQMLDSLAARQTPERWKRNSYMMESGLLHPYYN